MREFGRVGEFALGSLAEIFAAVDADGASAAGGAALAQRARLALAGGKPRDADAIGAWPVSPRFVDVGDLALWAGDLSCGEIDGELVSVELVLVGGAGEMQRGEDLDLALLELFADFEVAVGGVADHPLRPSRCGLL